MSEADLKLRWMADELRAAGLSVVEHEGWRDRSADKPYSYTPVGILNHHTAGSSVLVNYPDPPYWSNERLEYACNITIRPNGEVCVLNAGIANDSGMGDPDVLARLLRDESPTAPTDFDADDRVTGNPWFIDIEVQHLGDGSPIVKAQYDALIVTNAVLLAHYGWNPETRLLGHREWTIRKIDPRWNGYSNPMHTIRQDTKELMEGGEMTPEQMNTLLSAIGQVPGKVWGYFPGGEEQPSAWQTLYRTYLKVAAGVTLTSAEQDELVAAVVDGVQSTGIASAVMDELQRRLVS